MTGAEVDAAMREIGLAWNILGRNVCDATSVVAAFSLWCNADACQTYANAANLANKVDGVDMTPGDVAAIIRLHVGDPQADPPTPGDSTQLRALLSG